jgi:hypothetical protein
MQAVLGQLPVETGRPEWMQSGQLCMQCACSCKTCGVVAPGRGVASLDPDLPPTPATLVATYPHPLRPRCALFYR